ncbi:MAG: hypothetical protein ACLR0M_10905 [[Clostridium] symbiosum]
MVFRPITIIQCNMRPFIYKQSTIVECWFRQFFICIKSFNRITVTEFYVKIIAIFFDIIFLGRGFLTLTRCIAR